MNFSNAFIEELRNRLSLTDIISRKVVWDPKKTNTSRGDYWAPCPFHSEKTASFHVDDNKGFYYCFGCHAKGDAFEFLKESENLSFAESVEFIATHLGIQIPAKTEYDQTEKQTHDVFFKIHEIAIIFYKSMLEKNQNLSVKALLKRRHLESHICSSFQIGLANRENATLFEHLIAKGYTESEIIESGLCIKDKSSNRIYDRFRNRLMFPIRNLKGQAIGFGGRALSDDANAKYLNSPETKIFHKGKILYNAFQARKTASRLDSLYVVEGYMDVIALSRAGISNAVAPLGTAITLDQLKLLWRLNNEPVLAFDGDPAGLRAAMKLLDLAVPEISAQNTVRFCLFPKNQDPDDLLNSSGKEMLQKQLQKTISIADLLWFRETENKTFDSPERKAALDLKLKIIINKIKDKELRSYFRASLAKKRESLFGISKRGNFLRNNSKKLAFREQINVTNLSKNSNDFWASSETKRSQLGQSEKNLAIEPQVQESAILLGIINYPDIITEHLEDLSQTQFLNSDLEKILKIVLRLIGQGIINRNELTRMIDLELGFNVLKKLYSLGNLAVNPYLKKNSTRANVIMVLKDALERKKAYSTMKEELRDAELEITTSSDENLTNRLSNANQILQSATKGKTHEGPSDNENSKEDAKVIRGLIKDKIWIKKRTNKNTNQ